MKKETIKYKKYHRAKKSWEKVNDGSYEWHLFIKTMWGMHNKFMDKLKKLENTKYAINESAKNIINICNGLKVI